MKRRVLTGKEVKELNAKLAEQYGLYDYVTRGERVEVTEQKIIAVKGKPSFFYLDAKVVPTLRLLLEQALLPKVTIDMPAVKFIVGGADVMRPGIKAMDSFAKDALVAVVDEQHGKALAVGLALFCSEEIEGMQKGKVIKNLHFVGDEIWKSG